eukprot:7377508-Prymnesium_polylepis.2
MRTYMRRLSVSVLLSFAHGWRLPPGEYVTVAAKADDDRSSRQLQLGNLGNIGNNLGNLGNLPGTGSQLQLPGGTGGALAHSYLAGSVILAHSFPGLVARGCDGTCAACTTSCDDGGSQVCVRSCDDSCVSTGLCTGSCDGGCTGSCDRPPFRSCDSRCTTSCDSNCGQTFALTLAPLPGGPGCRTTMILPKEAAVTFTFVPLAGSEASADSAGIGSAVLVSRARIKLNFRAEITLKSTGAFAYESTGESSELTAGPTVKITAQSSTAVEAVLVIDGSVRLCAPPPQDRHAETATPSKSMPSPRTSRRAQISSLRTAYPSTLKRSSKGWRASSVPSR